MLWFLSALSGSIWGLLASYLLTDGRVGQVWWTIVPLSVPIGIIQGIAALRVSNLPVFPRCLYSLASLYVAVGMLGLTLGLVTAIKGAPPDAFWIVGHPPSAMEIGSPFMINYRVDNLDEMLAQLRAGGVPVIKGPESHENGKFAWIMDPDGNKVELWEPMIWDDKNKRG
jgi:catechol 2,3-dioxygenase-like lactoylglutathione lyase family enzyme